MEPLYLSSLNAEQKAVVEDTEGYKVVLAGAGCVSGDTEINFNRAGKGFKTTIKKAFNSFNNEKPNATRGWCKSIKTYVRSLKSSTIQLNEVEGIVYSGVKKVYELKLENGYRIKATSCHRIMTQDGWVRLGKLTEEHFVMCDTLRAEKSPRTKKRVDKVVRSLAYHPFGAKCGIGKKRVEVHRLVYEASINGMSFEEFVEILKTNKSKAKKLKFLDPKKFDVHHINGLCTDDRPENLIALTKEDHIKMHVDEQYMCFNQGVPKYSKVVSINYVGKEDTYDIQCTAPFHNFVANGMVIHNSGKTKTIISKVAYLIEEKKVFPNHILVGTFTKQAKEELTKRLASVVGEEKASRVRVGTLHSIAYKIYVGGLTRVDNYNKAMLPKILVNTGGIMLSLYNRLRNNSLAHSKDAKDYLMTVGILKMQGVSLKNFEKFRPLRELDSDGKWCYNRTLLDIWRFYDDWKVKNRFIDFGDMLVKCVEMLENKRYAEYLESLQKSCRYVIIDEAQDNNDLNYRMAYLLSSMHKNFTAVGDSRQAIYSFQGASLSNLHNYIGTKSPKIFNLTTNYRSSAVIVDNSNHFIRGASGILGKESKPFKSGGEDIEFMYSFDSSEEAGNVFTKIRGMLDGGKSPRDIAVLYRIHSQAVELEAYLMLCEIPYVTLTDDIFFDRAEVKAITDYLTAFSDPDKITVKMFKNMVKKPNRYLTTVAVDNLIKYAEYEGLTIYEALLDVHEIRSIDDKNKSRLIELRDHIVYGSKMYNDSNGCSDVLEYILTGAIGYERWAMEEKKNTDTVDSDSIMNLDSIRSLLRPFRTVEDFLKYVKRLRENKALKKDMSNANCIKLMTYHASKGKEFDTVFTLGNCTRIAPFHRSDDTNEEKRLMYVAITRPETKLIVSVIDGKLGRYDVRPSPFLYQFKNFNSNVKRQASDRSQFFEEITKLFNT